MLMTHCHKISTAFGTIVLQSDTINIIKEELLMWETN